MNAIEARIENIKLRIDELNLEKMSLENSLKNGRTELCANCGNPSNGNYCQGCIECYGIPVSNQRAGE